MSGYKVPVVVFLTFLILVGWAYFIFFGLDKADSLYADAVGEAQNYYTRGLYQLSASKYEEALKYKDTTESWDKMLDAFALQYAQDEKAYPDYLSTAKTAYSMHPQNLSYLNIIADLYIKEGKYAQAYDYLKDAVEAGIKDETVLQKYLTAKYSFKIKTREFAAFSSCPDSRFTVSDGALWGMIDEKGAVAYSYIYNYISPADSNGMLMYVNQDEAKLIDGNGVVQGIFSKNLESSGYCSEDIIAIRENGRYAYYSIVGDKLFGDYEASGTFSDGFAAVKKDGKWGVIDKTGKFVVEPVYEDIKLDSEGKYICNSVILAKENGQYHLYDKKWNIINDFSCEDADIPTQDGVIAYMTQGKWGFADTKGTVVIDPQYDNAKSFSNGLAAVCKGGLWGFIDSEGNNVIELQFLDADYFTSKGGCMVLSSIGVWKFLLLNVVN